MMKHVSNRFTRIVLFVGVMTSVGLCAYADDPVLNEQTVSLQTLITRTLDNDPQLTALRGGVDVAEAVRRSAAPLRNPQVRLGYSEGSDTADLESILDPSVLPSNDLSDRSEQYSAQVRLYPRNPFVAGAQKKRAALELSRAERELITATHARSMDVCEQYIDTISACRSHALKRQENELQQEEDAQQKALFEAGRLSADEYSESRIRGLEILIELGDAEQAYLRLHEKLLMDAGLSSNIEISREYPAYMEPGLAGRLNVEPLIEVLQANNVSLAAIDTEHGIAKAELSATKAEGVPWLNLISATYQRDERYNIKYRDEFSVVAGIELPIFNWLSGKRAAPAKARLKGLDQQYEDTDTALRAALKQAVNTLKTSEERLTYFQEREKEIRDEISRRLSELESAKDLLQIQQAIRYKRMLINLEEKSIRMKHDHAQRIIDLERLLGVRLSDLM